MKYGYYPIQETLPFLDLPPMEETVQGCNVDQISQTSVDKKSVEFILEHKDATLLFMTLTVSMTAKNEMPIVRPYTGKIPTDIRGIHRIAGKQLYHVAPHFYFSDEQILKYWNNPFKTEKILAHFAVSIGIDFSMTNEMSRAQKINASFLNKLWVAWLQSRGRHIIPNVSFPDEWLEDYWIEGWPKHSILAISSVGVTKHGNSKEWMKAVERIRRELLPVHILRYGPKIEGEDAEYCTYFTNDNNRSANGWQ